MTITGTLAGLRYLSQWLALALASSVCSAGTAHVAVASNFATAIDDIADAFARDSKHRLVISTGSSGKLYAQITQGAPFQVFLSADRAKPAALVDDGLAVAASRFTYAEGTLVLWSPEPASGDLRAALGDGRFTHLALANPRLAPYGAAAVAVLESLGLIRATREKWVLGENIAQTYQFVSTGNADMGFVARSQLPVDTNTGDRGATWIVPHRLYPAIRQDVVLLERGRNDPAARALMHFLRSDAATRIIRRHGYHVPHSEPGEH